MPVSVAAAPHVQSRAQTARGFAPLAAWTLGFALVTYLALAGGGFDIVVRSDVGIALWWLVLVGAVSGLLPAAWGRGAWTAVGLLVAFAVWTGIAVAWSGSADRTVVELGRVSIYAGALVLALATQRAVGGRALLHGVTAAIGLVSFIAVLSRLHPSWFPHNDLADFFPDNARRLSYPLNYWNGMAAFAAMGVPLLAVAAREGATVAGRALAAAGLPVVALCIYFTVSRGGVLAALVGVAVLMATVRGRLSQLVALAPATLGAVILVAAASQRHDLREGLATSSAHHQGDVMLAMALVVVAGVGLVHVTFDVIVRRRIEPWLATRTREVRLAGIGVALLAIVVAVAAGIPGRLSDDWNTFKSPDAPESRAAGEDVFARLGNPAGNGRYQYWMSAKDAGSENPFEGIGPGTFEFWWTPRPTFDGPYVHHAHSLWWETYGELGIPGLLLIAASLLTMLGIGIRNALRAPPAVRGRFAAATAGLATFLVFASYDWGWTLPVLPCAALVLAAVAMAGADDRPVAAPRRGRIGVAVLAALALPAVAIPLAGASEVRESQQAGARGDLPAALAAARTAVAVQPYAASAHVQEALVLEGMGALRPALAEARRATDLEPGNWTNWVIRSRLEARTHAAAASTASYRRARSLNPTSPIFAP